LLAGTNAPITLGNLTIAGTVAVNISESALTNGNLYPLIQFNSLAGGGNFVLGAVTAGVTATLAINGNTVFFIPTSTTRPNMTGGVVANQLMLSWPQDHTGWRLQMQTNNLGTNWFSVSGSQGTNRMLFPIMTTNGSAFFRLVYP
jgi:hypothetical protein